MATNYPLLLYYSMGCCDLSDGQRKCARRSSPVLFAIFVVCYGIVMGVGWYLWWANQDNSLILTAAIVSSIPGLGIISYFCSAITIKFDCCEEHSLIKCGIFTIEASAGLLQIVGAALFIYAVVTSSALSESPNPSCFGNPGWCIWHNWWMCLYYLGGLFLCFRSELQYGVLVNNTLLTVV